MAVKLSLTAGRGRPSSLDTVRPWTFCHLSRQRLTWVASIPRVVPIWSDVTDPTLWDRACHCAS